MKLTLQLAVVVLMLKRIFVIIYSNSPSMLPFLHNFFHEIRTPTVNKQARIVEIR